MFVLEYNISVFGLGEGEGGSWMALKNLPQVISEIPVSLAHVKTLQAMASCIGMMQRRRMSMSQSWNCEVRGSETFYTKFGFLVSQKLRHLDEHENL